MINDIAAVQKMYNQISSLEASTGKEYNEKLIAELTDFNNTRVNQSVLQYPRFTGIVKDGNLIGGYADTEMPDNSFVVHNPEVHNLFIDHD